MNDQDDFIRARNAVNAKIAFYIHLTVYLIVNTLLVFINLATSSGRLWFLWPLFGWGIGIIAHAVATFWLPGLRDRMIEKEMKKHASKD